MHQALIKSIGHKQLLSITKLEGIDTVTKALSMQSKFNIPTTAFDAISSITKQQDSLFRNQKGIM